MASMPLAYADSSAGVRLGLLFNFLKFTEWPAGMFDHDTTPLTICLVRGDPDLDDGIAVLDGRKVHEHPVRIAMLSHPDQAAGCQALYLPASASGSMRDYLGVTRHRVTLTVSDLPDFIDNDGMIGLVLDVNHYVFEINNERLRQAQLRLHPQVLKLAVRVK
jgi:hypothetical protein